MTRRTRSYGAGHGRAVVGRTGAAASVGILEEADDVLVEEGVGLLGDRHRRVLPRRPCLRLADDALEDEAVGRLGHQDLLQAALVHEGADGAKDLLVVLARTAFIDAHREPPWIPRSMSPPALDSQAHGVRTAPPATIDRRRAAGKERPAGRDRYWRPILEGLPLASALTFLRQWADWAREYGPDGRSLPGRPSSLRAEHGEGYREKDRHRADRSPVHRSSRSTGVGHTATPDTPRDGDHKVIDLSRHQQRATQPLRQIITVDIASSGGSKRADGPPRTRELTRTRRTVAPTSSRLHVQASTSETRAIRSGRSAEVCATATTIDDES